MIEANGHDWRGEPRPTRREAPHANPAYVGQVAQGRAILESIGY